MHVKIHRKIVIHARLCLFWGFFQKDNTVFPSGLLQIKELHV